jgi:hypothetical protein
MNWQEILTILGPILGLMGWVYHRIDKKLDKMTTMMLDMNMRLTRLEGRFEERGYWESRRWDKNGTEDKGG